MYVGDPYGRGAGGWYQKTLNVTNCQRRPVASGYWYIGHGVSNRASLSGEDAVTGDTDKYLRPQDLKELGDDSLPQEGYMGFSLGARSASPRISSDRSNTLNRSSYTRDSMMIEEILAPKDTHLAVTRECNSDALRRYSWAPDSTDNAHLVSSPIHSGFLVSFMVDARGGSMRGSRHNGMRIIIPPRKCTAPTRITCRLVRRHKLASPPPMVEGEGLASRLVEVGPAGAQFLGPVIVEIPHFGSMRGKERELIVLRSDNGETWKEHQYDYRTEELSHLLNGMDEELDSSDELEKKRICRIVTRDFPQYFAVVSRIKQESNHMGPEGGVLTSVTVPMVRASFPEGALTKRIRVGLQAQPVPDELVKKIVGSRATFSPIVTVEPRRRKFHKPITMTIPVPPPSGEGILNGYRGDSAPCLRLLCSITGGTSPAQWEDITGTTPLSFVTECVSFTTNVSARFWLADCHQLPETVGLAAQLYRELICVPYMAKFVVFAKMNDPVESRLRCFCMTDDKVDKTLEQQENFEEVARSKDIEVLEGKPIHVDCYGNVAPLIKTGQQLVFNFYAFKENRLPFCVKIRDVSQEPCGRLSFLKEPKTAKGLPQTAICNLNIALPTLKKADKPERRHTFASLALRKRYSYLAEPATSPESPCERTDLRMAIVADHLGLSWTELAREMNFSVDEINHIRVENPNSLTAQSFMLLKKWVKRDGNDATTDALTTVLTKVNRMDIVTLLEGPIFDYGNISGTRSFADDNSAFLDQADGFHKLQMELLSPSELGPDSPGPLWTDDVFSEEEEEDSRLEDAPKSPSRPCELALCRPHQDPTPGCVEEEPGVTHDAVKESGASWECRGAGEEDSLQEGAAAAPPLTAWALALGEGCESDEEEEEEDMAQEQLNSLREDSSEGQERENAVQSYTERRVSSIPGWGNETPNVTTETQAQGRSLSTEPNSQQEISQETSSESTTLSSKGRAAKAKQNGEHTHPSPQATALHTTPQQIPGAAKGQDEPTGPGRGDDVIPSERRPQHGEGSHQKKREGRNGDKKIHS